jgi:hypothetical protein
MGTEYTGKSDMEAEGDLGEKHWGADFTGVWGDLSVQSSDQWFSVSRG